ncbi:MAG TPA: RluA family pseudouridine synthase [Brumimicrobium sp.]|nr:RluA family pseudouridine synthase [Brumimicrobium sp.]
MAGHLPSQKVEIESILVEDCKDFTRIYDYLVGKLETITTRKGIKKALSREQITLNNKLARSADYVQPGDVIRVHEKELFDVPYFEIDLNVIFEDNELAIVEKPAGIPVSGNAFKTLQNALHDRLKISTAIDYLPIPLPVHRLDALTHGIVIVAKTHSTRVDLGRMFEERKVIKHYVAIVQGKLGGSGALNTFVDEKSALTKYQSTATYPSVKNNWISVLKLSPITGRKHQLRVHLSRLGFPIIGDQLYGKEGGSLKHKGLFLAAVGISFIHPKTNENLFFEIEVPNKFNRFLEREKRWVERVELKKK